MIHLCNASSFTSSFFTLLFCVNYEVNSCLLSYFSMICGRFWSTFSHCLLYSQRLDPTVLMVYLLSNWWRASPLSDGQLMSLKHCLIWWTYLIVWTLVYGYESANQLILKLAFVFYSIHLQITMKHRPVRLPVDLLIIRPPMDRVTWPPFRDSKSLNFLSSQFTPRKSASREWRPRICAAIERGLLNVLLPSRWPPIWWRRNAVPSTESSVWNFVWMKAHLNVVHLITTASLVPAGYLILIDRAFHRDKFWRDLRGSCTRSPPSFTMIETSFLRTMRWSTSLKITASEVSRMLVHSFLSFLFFSSASAAISLTVRVFSLRHKCKSCLRMAVSSTFFSFTPLPLFSESAFLVAVMKTIQRPFSIDGPPRMPFLPLC